MERFAQLLQELGVLINVPLKPDKNGVCQMKINNALDVQLEDQPTKDRILVGCFICDLPAGKFREEVLKEALKANSNYPRKGTLSYSERNNKLVLFDYLYYVNIRTDTLEDYLTGFFETANAWRESLERGLSHP